VKTRERVASTDRADGYEAVLDGPASLFSRTRKYGIRMANFLPALPLCDRWEMEADILVDRTTGETRQFTLDHTQRLESHYSAGERVSRSSGSGHRSILMRSWVKSRR